MYYFYVVCKEYYFFLRHKIKKIIADYGVSSNEFCIKIEMVFCEKLILYPSKAVFYTYFSLICAL